MPETIILPSCYVCRCKFQDGEDAFQHDIKVIDVSGEMVTTSIHLAYVCENCNPGFSGE